MHQKLMIVCDRPHLHPGLQVHGECGRLKSRLVQALHHLRNDCIDMLVVQPAEHIMHLVCTVYSMTADRFALLVTDDSIQCTAYPHCLVHSLYSMCKVR